jgi:hypothetical protein
MAGDRETIPDLAEAIERATGHATPEATASAYLGADQPPPPPAA